ncbi:MAG TPA: gliding motility lipoprotein GldH [Chitinophagaceae bacterium]|nr:gliding motility lipoprotein GldH [Chitinophagaceae bacterium]
MLNIQLSRIHYLVSGIIFFSSCITADLYEKTVSLPDHEWKSDYKPEFDFIIKDTTSLYQAFFVIRHTEKYNYNNIWINLYSQPPGDTLHKAQYELVLATNEKGWLASGMDDIYEQRRKLTEPVRLRAGTYKLILENIMREDPLKHILNVGVRIEKVK